MSKNSRLLNNADAADFLGVTPTMLRIARYRGELFKGVPAPKFLKLGAAVRYPRENLENWLSEKPQFLSNEEISESQKQS
jgi:hypothetical protein|tara:strand:+ start:470 stop:709 length:240 start_codon:yes stop_codon:yes gene_type:complete